MTWRILPKDEWHRIAHTETSSSVSVPDVQIVVVEDAGGQIVGSWALYPVWHAEGIWIAPEHRGHGAVLRRLLVAMRRLADSVSALCVWTASKSDAVAEIMTHNGAMAVPGVHYVMPVHGDGHGH